MNRRLTRARRRAVTLAGLVIDALALAALIAAVLAGAIPPHRAWFPAMTLAAGITFGAAFLLATRSRP